MAIGGCASCSFICVQGCQTLRKLRAASDSLISELLGWHVLARAHLAIRLVHEYQLRLVRGTWSSATWAKAAMMMRSPTAARRAAEPLTEIMPLPRWPLIA